MATGYRKFIGVPAIDRKGALQVLYASTLYPYSPVAQSVEQVTVNHWVGGSSPSRGAILNPNLR